MADMSWLDEIEDWFYPLGEGRAYPKGTYKRLDKLVALVRLAEASAFQIKQNLDDGDVVIARSRAEGLLARLRLGEVEDK